MSRLTRQDFERLLEFRVTLRRFHRWSEDQAQAEGLTHVQHQLLVAIKGHHGTRPPTVGDLAGYLLLRPHSTVELVDRAEAAGLVERTPDGDDGRVVRVRLTRDGDRVLHKLTRAHLERLRELATVLDELVTKVRLNGKELIAFQTNHMVFGVVDFLVAMTRYLTLYPGDVLWMGTEGATENMKHGDVCEIEITGIGTLRNPVVREN